MASRTSTGFRPQRSDSMPDERRHEDHDHGRDRRQPERNLFAERTRRSHEGRHVGDPDIISDRSERRDRKGAADGSAMMGEAVAKRAFRDRLLGDLPMELGRFLHRRPGDPHGSRERCAEEEGDSPAPARKVRLAHRGDGERGHADREQGTDLARGGGGRCDQPAPVRAGRLRADRRPRRYIRRRPRIPSRSAKGSGGRPPLPRSANGSGAKRSRASPRSSPRPTAASCAAVPCGRRYGRRRRLRAAASDKRRRNHRARSGATRCPVRRKRGRAPSRSRDRA